MTKAQARKRCREAAAKLTNVMLQDGLLTQAQYVKAMEARRTLLNLAERI